MSEQFDAEYVKKLREEAAKWRTQCRELEAQQKNSVVQVELAKRGIQADPSWVRVEDGQDVGEAIDALVAQYPHLGPAKQAVTDSDPLDFLLEEAPKPRMTPKPIAPSTPQSTTPKPARAARITKRNINEIRKDPKARAKVRDLYRDLLAKGSNQGE